MTNFINWNGAILPSTTKVLFSDNETLRYGDGCFETMQLFKGRILLFTLHMHRLMQSLRQLNFQFPSTFTATLLHDQILTLAQKNGCAHSARIRLTIVREATGFNKEYDLGFIIHAYSLLHNFALNNAGLKLDLYPHARKNYDSFSAIKSASYLGYLMASRWAKQNELDDCILVNSFDHVVETSMANVFIIHNGLIKTPPITDGCIAGVMRKYLVTQLKKFDYPFEETSLTLEDIEQASEIFSTNTIRGLQWVGTFKSSQYSNDLSAILHQKFIVPLLG